MAKRLRSYLAGQWHEGGGNPAQLKNPTTEEVMAEASTEGLDFGAGFEHARRAGGAALRDLSFEERGELLAKAASAIHEYREELVEMAIRQCGNTRGDAKFDIDGCTSTLSYYAGVGKDLGDEKFLVEEDEDGEQIGRNPRLIGRHVSVPRLGVAVHVNAFNFPAWGFGEKAACSILAGMPVVTKPATATAMVTERIFEILVEADVFPDGVVSLVAGGAGDMLSHLQGQDVLSFTGSSDTAAKLRALPAIVQHSVRINVEADSLNCAVLGADVEPGSSTFDLFAREVARDMTQKAGQKCTAIRRVFVPRDLLEPVREILIEEIDRVQVGDPSLKDVRMGPLATASQLRDVTAGIERLKEVARCVHGDGGRGTLVGVEGDKGYFVTPTLLEVDDAATDVVHDFEVFGPVATLLPYGGDAAEAVALVNRGQGGLVGSCYTDDRDLAREFILGAAAYHGRLNLGSAKVAEHSLGPGTVMPQLIHGGPGRAGGGEELGGKRGLHFYMQRTAVQGQKQLLAKILG